MRNFRHEVIAHRGIAIHCRTFQRWFNSSKGMIDHVRVVPCGIQHSPVAAPDRILPRRPTRIQRRHDSIIQTRFASVGEGEALPAALISSDEISSGMLEKQHDCESPVVTMNLHAEIGFLRSATADST